MNKFIIRRLKNDTYKVSYENQVRINRLYLINNGSFYIDDGGSFCFKIVIFAIVFKYHYPGPTNYSVDMNINFFLDHIIKRITHEFETGVHNE